MRPDPAQGADLNFQFDPAHGSADGPWWAASAANPSWITINTAGTHLYAANEVSNFEGDNGCVTAYAIDHYWGADGVEYR